MSEKGKLILSLSLQSCPEQVLKTDWFLFGTIDCYTKTDLQPVHAANERHGTRLLVSRDFTRFKMSARNGCNWIETMMTKDRQCLDQPAWDWDL